MRKRHLWIVLLVLVIAAVVAALFLLRKKSPTASVRLLPESDVVIYIDVDSLRTAGAFNPPQKFPHDPDYEDFVKQTGFDFERDLHEVAFAVQPGGPPAAGDQRSSEAFIGHFESARVTAYLTKLASGEEKYRNVDIYTIPHEGRPVRVAILTVDTVAVSNLDSPQAIHTMIDNARASAVPVAGPKIVRDHMHDLPLGTVAWAMANISTSTPQVPGGLLPGMVEQQLRGSTVIATVGYAGSLSSFVKIMLRVQAITPSEDTAKQLGDNLNSFLTFFRGLQQNMQTGGMDEDVKAFFDSLKVEQKGERVTVSAELTRGFLQKIMTEPPAPPAPPATPATTPTPKRHRKK